MIFYTSIILYSVILDIFYKSTDPEVEIDYTYQNRLLRFMGKQKN